MRWIAVIALSVLVHPAAALDVGSDSDVSTLIPWLLHEERELAGIPFGDVIFAATGKKVIPIDPAQDEATLKRIGAAIDRTLKILNAGNHPINRAARINEASSHVEDVLLAELSKEPGWQAGIPLTAAGQAQRSGYPDIRVLLEDESVIYLDPKLITADNKTSSFRTFYYEPKSATSKVNDDAKHLLIGICHNGKPGDHLQFESWEIVDLSKLRIRLKAEFQASNRDLYQDATRVLSGTVSRR